MNRVRTTFTGYWPRGMAALAILVALTGCDTGPDREASAQSASPIASTQSTAGEPTNTAQSSPQVTSAVAQIKPTSAGNAEGTVTFSADNADGEIRVTVELTGLEPGSHGFHVHEVGDCSADDASSAGGHFNPNGNPHGGSDAAERHVGDMGNIEADEDGQVSSELRFSGLALYGPASILQKAVVVHRDADDLKSQPSGDAGDRVGCGVIRSDGQGLTK